MDLLGFNPSVGILGVQAAGWPSAPPTTTGFQSLGRDSGCSSVPILPALPPPHQFQSLGRDSGCSSPPDGLCPVNDFVVSIPRSGFWVFKQRVERGKISEVRRFNPSVGILGVQARQFLTRIRATQGFQSLGRDSGCSSPTALLQRALALRVSIPRSGFWVFKPTRGGEGEEEFYVSIPRSGFWVFKLSAPPGACASNTSFNPSVGILGVQATPPAPPTRPTRSFNPSVGILGVQAGIGRMDTTPIRMFQSLGRDSGCSSSAQSTNSMKSLSFNPSVGILGVQADRPESRRARMKRFQSLGRDSGCSSTKAKAKQQRNQQFQSLGRDSGCSS